MSKFIDADLISKYMLPEEQKCLCIKNIVEEAIEEWITYYGKKGKKTKKGHNKKNMKMKKKKW